MRNSKLSGGIPGVCLKKGSVKRKNAGAVRWVPPKIFKSKKKKKMDSRADKLPPLSTGEVNRLGRKGPFYNPLDSISAESCDPTIYAMLYDKYATELDDEQYDVFNQNFDEANAEAIEEEEGPKCFRRKTKKPSKEQLESMRKEVVDGFKQE